MVGIFIGVNLKCTAGKKALPLLKREGGKFVLDAR